MANTPNFDLNLPASGASGWGDLLNSNFTALDSGLASASADIAALQAQGSSAAPGSATSGGTRQTILTGPTDTNGYANYLSASGLSANLSASSAVPVIVTFAKGFDGSGSVDSVRVLPASASCALTPNATNYIYAEEGLDSSLSLMASLIKPKYDTVEPSINTLVPSMIGNASPAPFAISASSSYSGGYAPYMAFDGSTTTTWATNASSPPQYLQIDMGSATTIGSYSIQCADSAITSLSAQAKDWTLQGSNDGSGWTVLDTRTNQTAWSFLEKRTYHLANSVSYRHYRLNITANNGGGGETDLGNMQFYSAIADGADWFDIGHMEMNTRNAAASAWNASSKVFLGEIATNGSAATSVVTYGLRSRYSSLWTSLSVQTTYNLNHNLGFTPENLRFEAVVKDVSTGNVMPFHVDSNIDYSVQGNNFAGYVSSEETKRLWVRTPTSYLFDYKDSNGNSQYSGAAGIAQLKVTLSRNW